ncbi:MAG: HAD family hydrolase [Candidatus Hydrogenedentota bacterium]|nr:MAG: HAD family hydrolase [Candidatus Hydrogenedentota bacterium]
MANLVIFDIDGTLVNSVEIDTICFVRSIKEEFGIHHIDERWETYRNVTDSGVLEEILEKTFARKPSESEIRRHVRRFLNLLEVYYSRDRTLLRVITGAQDIVKRLKNDPEWKIGIATGAWRESALFKLKAAGIDIKGIPIVTSSEAKSREDILRKCIDDSKGHYGVNEFRKIVSVGDGIWDLEAANKLGIGFVGINVPEKNDDFADYKTLKNYGEQRKFMGYLEEAD